MNTIMERASLHTSKAGYPIYFKIRQGLDLVSTDQSSAYTLPGIFEQKFWNKVIDKTHQKQIISRKSLERPMINGDWNKKN